MHQGLLWQSLLALPVFMSYMDMNRLNEELVLKSHLGEESAEAQ